MWIQSSAQLWASPSLLCHVPARPEPSLIRAPVSLPAGAEPHHLCDASVGEDVAGVDQSIKHLSCLFNQVTLVGVVFQLFI